MTLIGLKFDQGLESFVETIREKAPLARVTVGNDHGRVHIELLGFDCKVHEADLTDAATGVLVAEEVIGRWPGPERDARRHTRR